MGLSARTLVLFSLLFVTCHFLSGQGHEARLAAIDVQHYAFQLQLSDETDAIRGSALVTIRLLQSVPAVELDLVGQTGKKTGMTVSGVWEEERQAEFLLDGKRLIIRPAQPVAAGETRRYRIDYAGEPADGLVIGRNRHGDRTFFGDNWPNRAHHWLPCVDHPSDKATVEFIVTAPEHYQVVANGRQVEETNLGEGRKLTHWSEAVPIPTKVMVIGVAPFAVQYIGEVADIPLSSWVFPQDREDGFYDYAQAGQVLEWFIEHIGPYPYEKLANVQSKTRYGGMENAGNIFYAENTVSGDRSQEALIAHEIAHQWFGNSASEANWHHVWLSEGFATYCTDLYFEGRYGRERLQERMREERETVLRFGPTKRMPVVDTTITDYSRLLSPNVYQKGAWVLHMLRREVGDDAFRRGLRAYYDLYRSDNALTAGFQRVMEAYSGKELAAFFQQWIFTPGHPELNLDWKYDAGKKEITLQVNQRQKGSAFRFPLEVEVHGPEVKRSFTLDIRQREQSFTFAVGLPAVEEVVWDPETWLLFEQR